MYYRTSIPIYKIEKFDINTDDIDIKIDNALTSFDANNIKQKETEHRRHSPYVSKLKQSSCFS